MLFPGSPDLEKTHLSVGLAVEAVRQGHTAYFLGAHES